MNAPLTRLQTDAETGLERQFSALVAPEPWRQQAFVRFAGQGLPNRRVEAWHFTDIRAAMAQALPLAAPAGDFPKAKLRGVGAEGTRLVFVNGSFAQAASDALPAGVSIRKDQNAPAAHGDAMVTLNHAFAAQAWLVEIAPGTSLPAPLQLIFAQSGPASATFSRVGVKLGAGAKATLGESYAGLESGHHINSLLDIELGDKASLVHGCDGAGEDALCVLSLFVKLGEGAQFTSFAMLDGRAMMRRQIFADLAGENANIALSGLMLGRGEAHLDTTLTIDHAKPHGTSREIFRSLLDEAAHGVYQGKVIVKPHAQKTDGKMMSKAILLHDGARMDNKPELEIFADDVVCGHGATVGGLDAEQIFYLQARGIARPEAEALLLEAFAAEVVEPVENDAFKRHFCDRLAHWLQARGGQV
ncbi:MAG: SufD family Fe-S cluster assembly protein [Hyphomicrobiales bacterium]|nr:SufD family Fe-S cluster assembly protein [Hyphomicrobiales bacterium]